ncbi:MAG: S41 family peptidase [Verrucomicrobiales bacterium]
MKQARHLLLLLVCSMTLIVVVAGCKTAEAKETVAPKEKPASETDLEYQALALKTFDYVWDQLNTYHFDRTFNGHDWNKVKNDFRSRAAKATNNQKLRSVLQEMLNLLGQSHMSIIPGDLAARIKAESEDDDSVANGNAEPGLEVRFWNEQFLITAVRPDSPAAKAGIKPGFLLLAVDDKKIAAFIDELPPTAAETHRELFAWKYVTAKLKGAEETEVKLECETGSGLKNFNVTREAPPGQTVKLGNFPEITAHLESKLLTTTNNQTIGYVHFNFWMLPTALKFNQVIDELRTSDGIIIDLRGNLGGLAGMVMGVAGHFIREPVSFGTMKMRDNELQFNINPRFVDNKGAAVQPYSGPVAILLDGMSVSASELFAFGMQENGRAKIVGVPTSGQALPSVTETLPNGDVFYHPFADFISKKGARIEGVGVIPDVKTPYSREALLAGKDQPLEAALQWFEQTDARHSGTAK